MITAVCLGLFGSTFALVGMKCTKIGGTRKNKARIACFAGGNFILSGKYRIIACVVVHVYMYSLRFSFSCFFQASAQCHHVLFMHTRY